MKNIQVEYKSIGLGQKPFIIAEMSGNHNQSLERALALVDAAHEAGADALKIQTYTADTMTIDHRQDEFVITDKNSLWHGYSLYELYQQAYTPWEWHAPIFERCKKHGLIGFSTPFDASAVDFLESLNVPLYKIASSENIDFPLLQKVAKTGKPVIMSTALASLPELSEAVQVLRDNGCKELILLKCSSSYPASPSSINLMTIPHMRELFQCEVGLSDHTLGVGVAIASIALGATVIEKHMTLSRADGGVDSSFSSEPAELATLVTETARAQLALGNVSYGATSYELTSLKLRRSLYVTEDVRAGDFFSAKNVRAIRPGLGLQPKYLTTFLGKQVKKDIKKGTPLHWDMI